MPQIKPTDITDCVDFIHQHTQDILDGVYSIKISASWIAQLEESDLLILSKSRSGTKTKLMLVEYHAISINVLETLARDNDFYVKIAVANNQSIPSSVLKILAKDKDRQVRTAVAKNQNTSLDILEILAKDKDGHVREAVAKNQNTSSHVLEILARDDGFSYLRKHVARNNNTPFHVLEILAKDQKGDVRIAVVRNENTPPDLLKILAKDQKGDVRQAVANNSNTPPDVLNILARDTNVDVRTAVANNRHTPSRVLEFLAKDTYDRVRQAVADNKVVEQKNQEQKRQNRTYASPRRRATEGSSSEAAEVNATDIAQSIRPKGFSEFVRVLVIMFFGAVIVPFSIPMIDGMFNLSVDSSTAGSLMLVLIFGGLIVSATFLRNLAWKYVVGLYLSFIGLFFCTLAMSVVVRIVTDS